MKYKELKYKKKYNTKKCTLVVSVGTQSFMNVFCNVGTVQADTTILEECVEAVAVGVGQFQSFCLYLRRGFGRD